MTDNSNKETMAVFVPRTVDITLCKGKNCGIRDFCERYTKGVGFMGAAMWFERSHFSKKNMTCKYFKGE